MDEDEIMIIDENICLLCLKRSCANNNIFTNKINDKTIHECLEEFCSISIIADSQLPENVCNTCKFSLEQSYAFQNQILKNYRFILDSIKIKDSYGHIVIEEINPMLNNENEDQGTNLSFDTLSEISNHSEINDNIDNTFEEQNINQDKIKHFFDQPIIPMTSSSDDDDDDDDNNNSDSDESDLCILPNDIVDSDLVEMHLKICKEKNKIAYTDGDENDNDDDNSHSTKAIAIENWLQKERKHVCDVCGTAFVLKKTLKAHIYRVHTDDYRDEYTKICSICNEEFQSATEYRKHVLTKKHSLQSKSHLCKCNKCNEWFGTKKELFYHRKVHFPKEFKCLECGQYFENNLTLQKHVKLDHKVKIENPNVKEKSEHCTDCGKYFSPSGFVCHKKLSLKCKAKAAVGYKI